MELKPQFRAKLHHTTTSNNTRREGVGLSVESREQHLTQDSQTEQRAAAATDGRGAPPDSYFQLREWKSQINKKSVESISFKATNELKATETLDAKTEESQEVESFHFSEKTKKTRSLLSSSWDKEKDEDDTGSRVSFGVSLGNGMTVNTNGTIGFDFGTGISLNSDGSTSFNLSSFL